MTFAWLPPHGLGGTYRSWSRQERQGDCLATPQRRTDHRLDLRSHAVHAALLRTRHGLWTCVRDRQGFQCENPESRRACPHRLVPLGVEYPARLAVSRWWANSPMPQTRSKDMLLELIGSRGSSSSIRERPVELCEPYDRLSDRYRTVCAVWSRSSPTKAAGDGQCQGHGLALPCIGASSAISRPLSSVGWRLKASSPFTKSTPRSTAACSSTRTDPGANRGRRDHGPEPRQIWRDHLQGRQVQQGNFDDFPVIRLDEAPLGDQRAHRTRQSR